MSNINKENMVLLKQLIKLDIIDGISRTEINSKLKNGSYAEESDCKDLLKTKDYTDKRISSVVMSVIKEFKFDNEIDKSDFRNLIISRYTDIHLNAKREGDYSNARQCLDSLVKLTGIAENQQIDVNHQIYTLKFNKK